MSAKGYSVNVNVPAWKVPYVREVLETSPARAMQRADGRAPRHDPDAPGACCAIVGRANNPILRASLAQVRRGPSDAARPADAPGVGRDARPVPARHVAAPSRPEQGARLMQREVQKRIDDTFL